jgi:hypothetical protein
LNWSEVDSEQSRLGAKSTRSEVDDVARDDDNDGEDELVSSQLVSSETEASQAKVAYEKATRKTQELAQAQAQEVAQEKRLAVKRNRREAYIQRMGDIPACPSMCVGKECNGKECKEVDRGVDLYYAHHVKCLNKAHITLALVGVGRLCHTWVSSKKA